MSNPYLRGLSSATQRYVSEEPLLLESGGALRLPELAYRTWGALNARGDNVIWVCHALTGSADVDVWWPGLLGPGRPLDTNRWFVVCANVPGSCYGSSGPLSLNPDTGTAYGGDFPVLTIRDLVRAQTRLADALGVRSIELLLGASMGGMQVLEWAALDPQRVHRIAPLATSVRHSAWCIAISEAQRAAIRADSHWRGGHYLPEAVPADGLAAARMQALVSYRSFDNFASRFDRGVDSGGEFETVNYLRYQGRKFVERFDAASYVRLTQAMDSHDLGRGRGGVARAAAGIAQPALVLSIPTDMLYPPREQRELAALLPGGEFTELCSDAGHDGFLIDTASVAKLLREFLDRELPVADAPGVAARASAVV